jgi:hypothetical protein
MHEKFRKKHELIYTIFNREGGKMLQSDLKLIIGIKVLALQYIFVQWLPTRYIPCLQKV